MRIIDRYIFREVFSHALLGLAVFTFVFFIPQLIRLMELVVRHSAGAGTVALLFLCTLPGVLTFTVPISVLVGVLIGLGRMSADSEVIALHALGIGLRRLLVPVGALALAAALFTLTMTLWLGPAALSTFRALEQELRASQASFQVQPRVFDERFPRFVLYVQDVQAAGTEWRGIFLAETETKESSRLTLAESAIVITDPAQGKLQFHLRNGSTHEFDRREPDRYSVSTFGGSDLPMAVAELPGRSPPPTIAERPISELMRYSGPDWREARIELHRRLSFPAACLVFALLGISVGAQPRRGGRAMGFVITVLLVCGYYILFVFGAGTARQGAVSPGLGIWAANFLMGLYGLAMLPRMEQIRAEGILTRWAEAIQDLRRRRADGDQPVRPAAALPAHKKGGVVSIASGRQASDSRQWALSWTARVAGFPLLMDLYILQSFFGYFVLLLGGYLLLLDSFTFFELLEDIGRNNISYLVVADYFRYLTPYLAYQLLPLAGLVAALVTLGVLSKNNEITAFKAGGVSLYRISLPLLIAGLALGAGMFLLDDTFLPYANQKQDALRNQIKGRPAQTFFQPRRQWIFGESSKVYNYELFDADQQIFGGLNVFHLDPQTFQLRRRVYASRAHWEGRMKKWVLEEGWVRDFEGSKVTRYLPFYATSLDELTETPGYFQREVKQHYQLNWRELRRYINELQQAGFDVTRLSVQWHKKFAYPLLTPIVILLAVPFAIRVGARGAIGGLALAVGIAVAYWALDRLFEAMGGVGQLPPLLSAWAPDAIFTFLGLYFFLKMPT
jgi:LPS export ABC transporter permease LptF/LPS export ABC transporter permease LptG